MYLSVDEENSREKISWRMGFPEKKPNIVFVTGIL